jgi:hypothetical protein
MVMIGNKEYNLEEKDEALVQAIIELTIEIRRLANG